MMDGYDIDFIKKISMKCKTPLSVIGGAGSLKDIRKLFHEVGIVGAGAGSLFIFKGKYKAVLINYPTPEEKLEIYKL